MPDRLKALSRLYYGRSVFLPGEEFIATPSDAKTLVAVGKAVRVEEAPVPVLLTRALEAEPDPVVEPEKRKPGRPRKSQYARRDMKAQD